MPPPPLPTPPPWEAVLLFSHCLDPKTLALASCVSRPWNAAMSSDDLWRPICQSHFPSLSSLLYQAPTARTSPSSYRALFMLLCNGSARRRRQPAPPRVALRQLVFAVDVFHGGTLLFSTVKTGGALECAGEGAIFQFDMGAGEGEAEAQVEPAAGLRVVWAVVGEGWEGAAVLMDCRVEGRVMGGGSEVWFSEELPPPASCSGWSTAGGLVAEVGLGLGTFSVGAAGDDEGKARRRKKVVVGLMSAANWRYVHVDDGLRYLQHFFS